MPSAAYKPHDPMTACSICTVMWHRSKMYRTKEGLFMCPDEGIDVSVAEMARRNSIATRKTRAAKAVKDARPAGKYYHEYQIAEAEAFNLIAADPHVNGTGVAPYEKRSKAALGAPVVSAAKTAASAYESIRYLANILVEERRNASWRNRARTKMAELCTDLINAQVGNGSGLPATTSAVACWGGIYPALQTTPASASLCPKDAAGAGLAFLLAYEELGTSAYLQAARNCAYFVRRCQCGDLWTSGYSRWNTSAGAAYHYGALSCMVVEINPEISTMAAATIRPSHRFYADQLLALTFLAKLRSVDGDGSIGDATAVGAFSASIAATPTTMESELRVFWRNGAPDFAAGDADTTLRVGLGSAYFRTYFGAPGYSTIDTPGEWFPQSDDSQVVSLEYACEALRALYAYEGATAQVTAVNTYLRAITSTDTTFSASRGLPPTVNVSTAVTPDTHYWWALTGLLAPLQSALDNAGFKASKDYYAKGIVLTTPARADYEDGQEPRWSIIKRTRSPFDPVTNQANIRALTSSWDDEVVADVARAAHCFRVAPTMFSVRDY